MYLSSLKNNPSKNLMGEIDLPVLPASETLLKNDQGPVIDDNVWRNHSIQVQIAIQNPNYLDR